jgi:Flp pilus assembly pilin Flp
MPPKEHGDGGDGRPNRAKQSLSRWLPRLLRHLINDTRAQDQVEYAVCVGTIALVAALAIPAIAESISAVLLNTQSALSGAPIPAGSAPPSGPPGNNGNCANPNPGNFQGRSPCAP